MSPEKSIPEQIIGYIPHMSAGAVALWGLRYFLKSIIPWYRAKIEEEKKISFSSLPSELGTLL